MLVFRLTLCISASPRFAFHMLIRYSDFEAGLKKRKFHANYFLLGADPFLVELAKKALALALEEASQGELLAVTLDLDDTPVDEFLNSAQGLSMFAPRQLLLVKGVMKLRENQGRRLAQYFADPNPRTVAVFLAGELDKDQRKKKIFEILSFGTQTVELAPLEIREVADWLQRQAGARGCSIEPDALCFLVDLQGTDLGRLQQEVEKALLYAGAEKQITLSMVEAVSGFAAGHTLFEFIDAIIARNKAKALELVEEIFFTGKETGLAFWWFGQQLRQWLQFKELAGKTPAAMIGKQVGIYNSSAAQRMQEQAKRFSQQSLFQAIERLASVDDKIKSTSVDSRFTMELLVHELTR
ncbi:MAG: DNA polymerase III subunit delta [Acidobacteria bacterium]|nr:DNA polymerase III subunit delta [Acidobacteriota bacterium]